MSTSQDIYNFLLSKKDEYFLIEEIALKLDKPSGRVKDLLYYLVNLGKVTKSKCKETNKNIYKAIENPQMTYVDTPTPKPPVTKSILDFVFENPNCTRIEIIDTLKDRFNVGSISACLNRKVHEGVLKITTYKGVNTYTYQGVLPKPEHIKITKPKISNKVIKPEVSSKSHDVINSIADLVGEVENSKTLLRNIRDQINQFLGE